MYVWSSLGNNEYLIEQQIEINDANKRKIRSLYDSYGDVYKSIIDDGGSRQNRYGQGRDSIVFEYLRREGAKNASELRSRYNRGEGRSSNDSGDANEDSRGGVDEKKTGKELSIAAYHGTALRHGIKPFNRFDWIAHQLEGEGAMMFGAGSYVTGSERIGRGYADVAKKRKDE